MLFQHRHASATLSRMHYNGTRTHIHSEQHGGAHIAINFKSKALSTGREMVIGP